MESPLAGGLPMTLLGLTTVFAALLMLIVVIHACARILSPRAAPGGSTSASGAGSAPQVSNPATPLDLAPVALAAYALHLQSCLTLVDPEPGSPWKLSGRMRQLTSQPR